MIDIPWYVFALLAALFVGLSGTVEKKVLQTSPPLQFALASTLLIGALSLPLLPFVAWHTLTPGAVVLLGALALLSFSSFCLTAFSLKRLEAGEEALLLAFSPALTALLAWLVLGEALSSFAWLGIGLIVLGLVILEFPHVKSVVRGLAGSGKTIALLAVVLVVCMFAGGSLIDRLLLTEYGLRPFDLIIITQALIFSIALVVWAFMPKRIGVAELLGQHTKGLFSLAMLLITARLFYAGAVATTFVALAVTVKRMSVLVSIFSARAYLHERGTGHKLVVAGFVLMGGLLVVV